MAARAEQQLVVGIADNLGRTRTVQLAALQHDRLVAEGVDHVDVVADEQDGLATLLEVLDPVKRLQRKARIANRQRFVDDKNIGVDRRRDGEGQARLHTARIGPERLVDELAKLGELDDLVKPPVDLLLGEAKTEAAQNHVLAAGIVRVKTSAELEDRSDPAIDLHLARRLFQRACDKPQKRTLACAVPAEHAEDRALGHVERHVAERAEFRMALPARERLSQHVAGPLPDLEHLGEAGHLDCKIAHSTFPNAGFRKRNARHPSMNTTTANIGKMVQA